MYGIPNQSIRAPLETDRERFVTRVPEVRVRDALDRHTTLTPNDSRFHAGSFITHPAPIGKSIDPPVAALQIKF